MPATASNQSADDPLILQGMATLEAQGYVIDKWQTVAGSHIFTVSRSEKGKPRHVSIDEMLDAAPTLRQIPSYRLYPIKGSVIIR